MGRTKRGVAEFHLRWASAAVISVIKTWSLALPLAACGTPGSSSSFLRIFMPASMRYTTQPGTGQKNLQVRPSKCKAVGF